MFYCRITPLVLPLPETPSEMVSRRRILSRSRDDLHMDSTFQAPEDEEDVWYQKEKLYKVNQFGDFTHLDKYYLESL